MKKEELLQKLTSSEEIKNVAYIPLHQVIEWVKELEETRSISKEDIGHIAREVASDLENEGLNILTDYDLDMNGREVELDNISLNEDLIERIVKDNIKMVLEL